MSIFAKHIETAKEAAKFWSPVVFKQDKHKQKNQQLVQALEELAKTLLLMEIQMADTALAIDKLETELDLRGAAIAARDRKIASQAAVIASLQGNALDDADKADIARVKAQTFDVIPPVTDDTATPVDPTPAPPVTPAV